jgi:hypothetical protein
MLFQTPAVPFIRYEKIEIVFLSPDEGFCLCVDPVALLQAVKFKATADIISALLDAAKDQKPLAEQTYEYGAEMLYTQYGDPLHSFVSSCRNG